MSDIWKPELELFETLVGSVPTILASQKSNGQFGDDPWICRDQHLILPLATAWSLEMSPYYHSDTVLEAIVRGGDALIDAQDNMGMWTFRKKDHSTWGQIFMPWTYSRWIRTYEIIREAVDDAVVPRWDAALTLGFEGIADRELSRIHNIPTHHAMALYCAGRLLGQPQWREKARDFLHQVVAEQSPHGWWTENVGPVVAYNFVYVDALGVYYHMCGDGEVLKALDRSAHFHAHYTYPDGSSVETVDERNAYHAGVHLGNPGFSYTDVGRGYLARQHALFLEAGGTFDTDYATNMLLAAAEGPVESAGSSLDRSTYQMNKEAVIVRRKPWFISLSAYICPPSDNRFRQDRQNFVSIFHDQTGLIIGGGNTKLQPLWSTCTVGDPDLLFHTPGDETPDFNPRPELWHIPDHAELWSNEDTAVLNLGYGDERYVVKITPISEEELQIRCETTMRTGFQVEGHLTMIPHLDQPIQMSSGETLSLRGDEIRKTFNGAGWITHAGWRLSIPQDARLIWPVLPHNPYRKQGDATIEEARIVVALPFSTCRLNYELTLKANNMP